MAATVPFKAPEPSSTVERPSRRGDRAMVLIVAEVVLAVGAFAGAVGLISGGIDLGPSTGDLPFGSSVLAGIALAVVCGALPTVVAIGAWRKVQWADLGHVVVGAALVGWIVVQVGFIGLGSWLQVAYALFGLGIAVLGIRNLRGSPRQAAVGRTVVDAARRRRVRRMQRWVLNPPMKAATWLGVVPGHVVIETTGRVTGCRRRNVVGMHLDGDTGWVVAEQGRHAGYVRNLEAEPRVRVRVRRRWRSATAVIVDDDDPQARLDAFAMDSHAAAVRRFGTALLTVRFDFDESDAPQGGQSDGERDAVRSRSAERGRDQ